MKFEKYDLVTWTSQAGGRTTTKTGAIVRVIPAGTTPSEILYEARDHFKAKLEWGAGLTRAKESYAVLVGFPGTKKKPRLYWPRTSLLGKVETPA